MSLHTRLTRSATVLLAATVVLALFALPATSPGIGSSLGARANPAEEAAPSNLMFVENAGQWPTGARFQVWGGPGTMWLAQDAIWITLLDDPPHTPDSSSDVLRSPLSFEQRGEEFGDMGDGHGVNLKLSFVGANPQPALEPSAPVETNVSYFLGNDPAQWRPEVPVYGGVRYDELYPGIDLVLGGDQAGVLPWSLEARPGAESSAVRLRVEGADSATLDGRLLRIGSAAGDLALPLPAAGFSFQVEAVGRDGSLLNSAVAPGAVDSRQANGPSHYAPADNPANLIYSTFLGGDNNDFGSIITVDRAASAYVTGWTRSSDFPTTPGAFDPSYTGSDDVFVVKLNAAGSGLTYATFIGGSGWDHSGAITVDRVGSAYVTGDTESSDFPTTLAAFDPSHNGFGDAFVVKLNPAGSEVTYATFLGGSAWEGGVAIAVDGAGHVYVTGGTGSSDFPTTPGAFDTSFSSGDSFVTKINTTGSGLAYSTFLSGGGDDIALDSAGSAYVTGNASSNFPATPGAFDTSYNGGTNIYSDACVAKLNASGSRLVYATFLGGSSGDKGWAIAVDGGGNVYVAGMTQSSNFPTTPGTFDTSYNYAADAFVTKINPVGSGLVYSTFLGTRDTDVAYAIAVDTVGKAYVTGWTMSSSFPVTANAFDESFNGGFSDAFVTEINQAGSGLIYSTFLGGSASDEGSAIAVDRRDYAYVTGYTNCWSLSCNFPTTAGAYDTSFNRGTYDAFVSMLAMGAPPPPTPTPTRTPTRTPTATPTRTPTPTPTATPLGPWAAWHAGDLPLLVSPSGVDAVVDYGNMATPVPLAAHVAGAALFDTGAISGTTMISTTLPAANGSYALWLIPAVGATTGQTLTVHVDIGPVTLTRNGWIARPVYLPLLVRR